MISSANGSASWEVWKIEHVEGGEMLTLVQPGLFCDAEAFVVATNQGPGTYVVSNQEGNRHAIYVGDPEEDPLGLEVERFTRKGGRCSPKKSASKQPCTTACSR